MSAIKQDVAGLATVRELSSEPQDLNNRLSAPSHSNTLTDFGRQSSDPLSGSAMNPARGALRIGGVPASMARTGSAHSDEIAYSLAQLSSEITQLRAKAEDQSRHSANGEEDIRRDIASVKDSIEHVEAFIVVLLPVKLDQMISEKLSVMQRLQESRQRMRNWLIVFGAFNFILICAALLEASTGTVSPAVRELLELVQASAESIKSYISNLS